MALRDNGQLLDEVEHDSENYQGRKRRSRKLSRITQTEVLIILAVIQKLQICRAPKTRKVHKKPNTQRHK